MSETAASALVRLASFFVPGDRREDWLEEWRGELAALQGARMAGTSGLPGSIEFAVGSLPHAMWMRMEGWTMDSVLQDLRFSARVLRRAPGFTVVAALTLALGIGANAAIFSLVNGLVLRDPVGVFEPDRLVQVARSYESAPRWDNFSWPAMKLIGSEARTLSGVAGYQSQAFVLGRGSETERVVGQVVTGSYFEVLGVSPRLGRLLQPADDVVPGEHPVVVLSHALWTGRYGADPSIVGTTVEIGSRPYEVVGVAAEGFAGIASIGSPPSVFVPAMMYPSGGSRFEDWGSSWINVVGRLADGVSFAEATASIDVVSARLRDATAVNQDMVVLLAEGVGLDPEGRAQARQISLILLLIVGLVLLLTCTNVANLSLSRASTRRTEVGVRIALGAGRARLIRQLVTESSLLAVGATLLAIPVVLVAGDLLPLVFPFNLSVSLGADARVYAFLIALGLLAGLLFGAAPAWAAMRGGVTDGLREGSSTGARSRTRLRDGLVISQLGLSLGLVTGAALLGRSVLNVRFAEPGFETAGLTAGFVDLYGTGRYDEEGGKAFLNTLVVQAGTLPGVRSATLSSQVPIAGGHSRRTVRPVGRDDVFFEAEYTIVGPRYFETMGIPIIRGRALGGSQDEPEAVVVVNESLAAMFWPGEDPIGQELQGDPNWRVVGLVPDVQMRSLRAQGNPGVYYPMSQAYSPFMALQLRSETGRAIEADAVRRLVASLDPELPVSSVVDMQAAMSDSMAETRTIGYLVAAFALLALLLAAVGLYGLVSYGVSQRVREVGIRIALGADPDSLVGLLLARGIGIAVLGVGMGLAVSYGLGLALESLLFGVARTDVPTVGGAALLLMVAAGVAAWLPARRASRVDAAVSLRGS
jgi:predicted permease